MMASRGTILGELDAANLIGQGLLRPDISIGSRRIHKRRLNRSSEEEYHEIPLDIDRNSPRDLDAFATIPVTLISYDTILYLGFSANKAEELWSEWSHWPATGPRREVDPDDGGLQVTFNEFITVRLDNLDDVHADDDLEWSRCLDSCGMSGSVQDAIMDPSFKTIRLTSSCIFWVKDTISMRYAGLEDIRRASRVREMELMRINSRPGGSGRGSRHGGGMHPSSSSTGKTPSQGRRSISGVQQQVMPGVSAFHWNSKTAAEVSTKPGNLVLFKGMDQGRLTGLFNDNGAVQSIQKLLSSAPSDFSGTRALFYFTPDYRVAEYYAAYAKRRSNCESVVMVCLSIPGEVIDNMEEPDIQHLYWPSPQRKQLVWRSKTVKSLPKPLRKYRDALLIIGTVSKGAERMYENMETWEDMSDACVLRIGSSNRSDPAVQYVFSGEEEGREFLSQHGKIEVYPFSVAELQALLARNL